MQGKIYNLSVDAKEGSEKDRNKKGAQNMHNGTFSQLSKLLCLKKSPLHRPG
jgi:hypothetical protein